MAAQNALLCCTPRQREERHQSAPFPPSDRTAGTRSRRSGHLDGSAERPPPRRRRVRTPSPKSPTQAGDETGRNATPPTRAAREYSRHPDRPGASACPRPPGGRLLQYYFTTRFAGARGRAGGGERVPAGPLRRWRLAAHARKRTTQPKPRPTTLPRIGERLGWSTNPGTPACAARPSGVLPKSGHARRGGGQRGDG
jgi:hypothetical protein